MSILRALAFAPPVLTMVVSTAALADGPPVLVAGPRIGGLAPFSQAKLTYSLGLDAGLQLLLDRQLGLVVQADFRCPTRTVTAPDPRLPGGSFIAEYASPELALFVGPRFLYQPESNIVPFAAVGLDVVFVRSEVDGTAGGQPFGRTEEQSTVVGFGARAGAGLRAGPGLVAGALELDLAPLEHIISGATRASSLALSVSYLVTL